MQRVTTKDGASVTTGYWCRDCQEYIRGRRQEPGGFDSDCGLGELKDNDPEGWENVRARREEPEGTFTFEVPGHCPSKKNKYRVAMRDGRGRLLRRPKFYRGAADRAFDDRATLFFRKEWGGKPPLGRRTHICIELFYYKNEPDDVGVAESVYDALQRAGVVADDRLLELFGCPAVSRNRVIDPKYERVEVRLDT
jgi:hypothetical protein